MNKADIAKSYQAVRNLFREGHIDDLTMHKMVVEIASDYAMIDALEEAVGLLTSVPADYFLQYQKGHLEDDDFHFQKVLLLVDKLVESKKINIDQNQDDVMYRLAINSGKVGEA